MKLLMLNRKSDGASMSLPAKNIVSVYGEKLSASVTPQIRMVDGYEYTPATNFVDIVDDLSKLGYNALPIQGATVYHSLNADQVIYIKAEGGGTYIAAEGNLQIHTTEAYLTVSSRLADA